MDKHQEKAYAAQKQTVQCDKYDSRSGLVGRDASTPNRPTTMAALFEAMNHLSTCESHMAGLRVAIYGEGGAETGLDVQHSLDSAAMSLSVRLASLAGELGTLRARLGVDYLADGYPR